VEAGSRQENASNKTRQIKNLEPRFASIEMGKTLEHDPEKWVPVFRKDHAQTKR
jgi:hypothetical protein